MHTCMHKNKKTGKESAMTDKNSVGKNGGKWGKWRERVSCKLTTYYSFKFNL